MRSEKFISIVVIVFNMRREAAKTLFSLSARYQEGADENDYEVIVVENGSTEPLTEDFVQGFGRNFSYYYLKDPPSSPAFAINFGVKKAKGEMIGIMIDGARMLTPGIIKYAKAASGLAKDPVIATFAWEFGPDEQYISMTKGYDSKAEDKLLSDIDWPKNGYRLFDISVLGGSSIHGWFMPIAESNCLFMDKATFNKLGGCDERFDAPGGGFLNLDLYERACSLANTTLFYILGEGNFHQVHGGACTNAVPKQQRILLDEYAAQYSRIRSKMYSMPLKKIHHIGHMPKEALKFVRISEDAAARSTPAHETTQNTIKNKNIQISALEIISVGKDVRIKDLEGELMKIKTSFSFRLGDIMTHPISYIRELFEASVIKIKGSFLFNVNRASKLPREFGFLGNVDNPKPDTRCTVCNGWFVSSKPFKKIELFIGNKKLAELNRNIIRKDVDAEARNYDFIDRKGFEYVIPAPVLLKLRNKVRTLFIRFYFGEKQYVDKFHTKVRL